MPKVYKVFDIEEGTVAGGSGYYRIAVRHKGRVVDTFWAPTMQEAQRKMYNEGYHRAGEIRITEG